MRAHEYRHLWRRPVALDPLGGGVIGSSQPTWVLETRLRSLSLLEEPYRILTSDLHGDNLHGSFVKH